jgi:hypothetical protein
MKLNLHHTAASLITRIRKLFAGSAGDAARPSLPRQGMFLAAMLPEGIQQGGVFLIIIDWLAAPTVDVDTYRVEARSVVMLVADVG